MQFIIIYNLVMDGMMIKTFFFKTYSTAALIFLLFYSKKTAAATMNTLRLHETADLKYLIAPLHRQVWRKAIIFVFILFTHVSYKQTHTDIL